jgi:hypothetical protein
MKVSEIINLIDEKKLNQLGKLYKIDKVNHKLTGKFILKSLVSCILKGYPISLRLIEKVSNNNANLAGLLKAKDTNNQKIDHSSIGKRLSKLEVGYFKDIYQALVLKYNKLFSQTEIDKFHRFDSTIITLSGKLLKDGLNFGGNSKDSHIKLSFGLKNSIPSSVRFCTQASESSEDVALVRAINEAKVEKESILLFDRGIAKADTFQEFTQEEKYFITRINVNRKYYLIKENDVNELDEPEADKLKLISDQIVNLYNARKRVQCDLRLIKAKNQQEEELWFLTNVFYLSAQSVCMSYKRRWEIEVFFRFIKQNLSFKHFISHNSNGMSVYLYCILIAAILFTIFKISNKLTGFKLALLEFSLALEKEIIKDIVVFCRGNPDLVDLKLGSNTY